MRRVLIGILLVAAQLTLIVVGLRLMFPLPSLEGRTATHAISPDEPTAVGTVVAPLAAVHPDTSGIVALDSGTDAFAVRALLARQAERSIDAQYYIWKDDLSGRRMLDELYAAAERGVRVRLLLDDNPTSGMDRLLAAIDAHPNIEVRLFNPHVFRKARFLGFASDFFRLNRRMHNKSFTVDNQATVIGGRNVGDEYFGATSGVEFLDLDVLAVGPAVQDTSRQFDEYWQSRSAYPADRLLAPASADGLAAFRAKVAADAGSPRGQSYDRAIRETPIIAALLDGSLKLEWAPTRIVYDDAAKALGKLSGQKLMLNQLGDIIGDPDSSLDLISPYFVPGEAGRDYFIDQRKRGVAIRILTNSGEATDVLPVHAGYVKYRRSLIDAGIGLFELRRENLEGGDQRRNLSMGSSGASLHAKVAGIDRKRIFVTSFNFDLRSIHLNSEMGLVIDSPALATALADTLDSTLDAMAYQPVAASRGQVEWIDRSGAKPERLTEEPGMSRLAKFYVWFMSLLPIEWLL